MGKSTNSNNRVVSCVGYHVTGSGAVDDYLKEFRCCVSTPFEKECRIFQDPDGVSDLEYNIVQNWHRLNSGFAIKRFRQFCKRYNGSYSSVFGSGWMNMVDDYIDDLIDFRFRGYWHADIRVQSFFPAMTYYGKRVIQNVLHIPPWRWNLLPREESYHVFLSEEEFLKKTISFTDKLISSARNGNNEGFLLLEQLIPTTNVAKCMRYFSDLKVIVVDRDPRDVYITHKLCNMHVLPSDAKQFCTSFRDSRRNVQTELSENCGKILMIRFEDLIYRYDETTGRIKDFLGLDESEHIHVREIFDPDVSGKNTRQWITHPEYREICEYIEKELPDFLYNFDL